MKKLIFILVTLIVIFIEVKSQEHQKLEYSRVIEVTDVDSLELKNRCQNWFAISFRNSEIVLRTSSENKLIAKPAIVYEPKILVGSDQVKGAIYYTLTVEFKNGKYRYIVSDFIHEGNRFANYKQIDFGLITNEEICPYKFQTKNWDNKIWNDLKNTISSHISSLTASLETRMQTSSNDENW